MITYQPTTFNFTVDHVTGLRNYEDDRVQKAYLNLRTLSFLVKDLEDKADLDLLDIQNNIQAKSVNNQTGAILAMFACKLLEGLSVIWTAGTGPAIAAMILGRIASGTITVLMANSSPTDDVQKKANEVRSGMLAIFAALKKEIDTKIKNLEHEWNTVLPAQGVSDLVPKGDVTIAELADTDELMPDQASPEYDDAITFLRARNRSILASQMLPVRWKLYHWATILYKENYTNDSGAHYDFDQQRYNPHTDEDFWYQYIPANPSDPCSAWFHVPGPSEGHDEFASTLTLNAFTYDKYKSYYNWCEPWSQNFTKNGKPATWNGVNIHQVFLVGNDGGWAPQSLLDWLFTDDGNGKIVKADSVETRDNVYRNWGLSSYNSLSDVNPQITDSVTVEPPDLDLEAVAYI